MADLNFPSNPQANDTYTANSRSFKYDGSKWRYVTLSLVTVNSGSGITLLNNLSNSVQDFIVGASGSFFNISSSGSTHTFNIPIAGSGSTGLLTTLAQTIAGAKTFSSDLLVSSSTASLNTTTGALSVTGGVGIGGSINVAGRINLWNSSNYTAFVSSATGNTVYTLPATSPATGSSVLQSTAAGVLSWVPMTASSSGTTSQNIVINSAGNANVFHPVLFTPLQSSAGSAVSADTTIAFNPSTEILYVSGLAVTNTTASTNSTSGALIVTGGVGIGGSLYVSGDLTINGTTTTINAVTLTVDDKNIELGSVSTPSDVTAEGGGITLKGATDKSISWYTGTGWSSSESWNLASGNTYKISNTDVLSNSSLGTGVTNSSLTALGTIRTGVWSGTSITAYYGGTGLQTTFTVGDLLFANTSSTWDRLSPSTSGFILVSAGTANTPAYTNPATLTIGTATTATNINVTTASTSASHRVLFTPASGSASGAAVSSNSTLVYNPSTDILSVSGLAVTSTTNSTSNITGALQVVGGVGISGRLVVGPEPYVFNLSNMIAGFAASANASRYIVVRNEDYLGTASYASMLVQGGGTGSFRNYSQGYTPNGIFEPSLTLINSSSSLGFNCTGTAKFSVNNNSSILLTLSGTGLSISATTVSTGTTTGALVVYGGVGISESVSVGGRLQMFNGANYTAFVSSASGNTVYTLPATSPATGSSVLQSTAAGVMSWVPMVAGSSSSGNTSQNVVINAAGNANVFHPVLFTPLQNSSGSAVSSDSTISFNPSTEILNVSGLAITSGTASTNTTTGALVVRGGLGVTGQLSFATASFGFTGITTNPTMSFIGATSSSPITLTVLTDNSLNWEGSQGSVFSIDSNLSTGEIFSVSDISGLPIISASAGQTVTFNEFGGYTQFGNGSINSSSTTTGSLVVSGGVGITGNANIGGTVRLTNTTPSTSSTTGAMTVSGGVGIGGSASIAGRLQLFNSSNYTAFVSSATGNTVYTLPATSPAVGTSYLTSNSSGVMSWTAPNKANYVLSFGAGFTPIADSADSVSLNVPYLPDGTLKYYYIKRIEYRNETLSGGTGLSFYLQRHTTGNASWNVTNTITAGSGASFYVGPSVYASSFTTIASSAGVAGSVVSGDYLRLFFTGVGSAANLSIAMTIEEQ